MRALLQNTSISLRVAVLCLVPMLTVIALGFNMLLDKRRVAVEMGTIAEVVSYAPVVSGLVHELQKERGTSAGFIGSKGKRFSDTIGPRRADTDKALESYRGIAPELKELVTAPSFKKSFDQATKALGQLSEKRAAVDAFALTVPQMASYYTPTIASLLGLVESVSQITSNGELTRVLIAYGAFLQGKERAGIERAMGAAGFGAGTFKPNIHKRFVRLGALQDGYFSIYRRYAPEDALQALDKAAAGPEQAEVDKLRKLAEAAPFGGDVSSVSGPQWFATSTKRIDVLKMVEDRMANDIVTMARNESASAWNTFYALSAVLAILALISAPLCFYVAQSIVVPIRLLSNKMRQLAQNDLTITVEEVARQDEIGRMARAVEVFRANAIDRARLERASQADRDRELQRQSYLDQMVSSFRDMTAAALATADTQTNAMLRSSEDLARVADDAAQEASSANTASQDASNDVQSVAAATDELTSSIREIAEQANKASSIVTSASEAATVTDKDVSALSEAAQKIGTVIELIRDIAEQTNLLALNATIEAARAGESGKGFAVVASEVKSLADQTAKATEEIAVQIGSIQNSTQNAVDSIRSIASRVDEISSVTSTIAAAVEEQQGATQDIARSLESASRGTGQAVENVHSVNAAIDSTAKESKNVREATHTLGDAMKELAHSVEAFLKEVETDVADRRTHLRHKMKQAVSIDQAGRRQHAEIVNISEAGAGVKSEAVLEQNSEILLELSDGRTVSGRVVRRDGEMYGVQFDQPLHNIGQLIAA